MLKKVSSLIIAVALVLSSLPVSGFTAISSSVFTADTINSYASVTEASFKNSAVSVFNIQDLHFNTETQKKIFSLLEKLNAGYPNMELYIEGASENSDFEWVYSSLGKKSGNIFLEALFDSGNISGAEFFSAKYGKKINSVEDKQIFDRNLLLFAELIEQRSDIENLISPLESSFANLRNKYFSSEQKRIFSAYIRYRGGSMSDSDYFDFLKKETFKNGIDINDYPNMALYMLTSGSVVSVSQKKLQSQMSVLFSNLKSILSYKQYSELLAISNNLKDRQALMSYLYQSREEINLKQYPELNKFIISIALSDKLNRLEFINEENNLSRDLSLKISPDENSKNILFMSRFIGVYKSVLTTSATADEYRYYKDNVSRFKSIAAQYVSADSFANLNPIEMKAVEFNNTNLDRNEIFINSMLGKLSLPAGIYPESYFGVEVNAKAAFENAAKSKIKVIVAGGFHTEGINELLNKKQITNVTFMPKITSAGLEHSQKYVEYARTLNSAGNAAIPLPVYNELTLAELSSRVLDTLFKERINKGFDLSSQALKEDVESFISARKDIEKIEFSYDADSDRASITYTDTQGKQTTIYGDSIGDTPAPTTTKLGTLGEFTAKTVREILRSISFNSTDTALLWMYTRILRTDSFYEGSKEALKQALVSGTFDFEAFFMLDRNALKDFILYLFEYEPVIEDEKQRAVISTISGSLNALLPGNINVKISDNPRLISEDGWCIGAMNVDEDGNADFYIHTALLEKLSTMDKRIADMHIQTFVKHELYEYNAIYDTKSDIYKSFSEFLKKAARKDLSDSSIDNMRTPFNFHLYLESSDFKRILPGGASNVQKQQEAQIQLLRLASRIAESYLGKHSQIQYIHKIKSLNSVDLDNVIKSDLAFLRLGDKNVTNKYINLLTRHIEKIIATSDKEDYVIAFRKTSPQHIIENIAREVAENIGVRIVFIEQDEYMDAVPLNTPRERAEIKDRLQIGEPDTQDEQVLKEEELSFKKVIVIEDTCKTGVLFQEISRILNKANVEEMIPLAIFDIREASILQSKDIRAGKVDASYDVNDYLISFANTSPELFAQAIISAGGNVTKYVSSALAKMNTDKDYEKSFTKILSNLDNATVTILLDNLIQIQSTNQEIAANTIALIYRIYVDKIMPAETKNVEQTFISWIQKEYVSDKKIPPKGILEIEDYAVWAEPFLTVAYAALNGYGRMSITLKDINYPKELLLKETAEQLNMPLLEMRESEDIHRQGGIKIEEKEELDKAVQQISKSIAQAKNTFAENIRKNDPDASKKYAVAIKEIMREVEGETKRLLRKMRKVQISNTEYALVVGGSIVKGSAMPNSDLYYNVIARGKNVSVLINENFIPFFEYIFINSAVTPYYSGGLLNTYLNFKGSSLVDELSFASQDITDERGIAAFLDFEPIDPDSVVFSEYLKHYRNRLQVTVKPQKIYRDIRLQLRSIMPQYVGMAKDGMFSRKTPSESGKLTFSQYLYAASTRKVDGKLESADYRWLLRAVELLLKDATLNGFEKQTLTLDVVREKQNTGDLIELLAGKKLLGDIEPAKLKRAWSVINSARQNKAAAGMDGYWTLVDSPVEIEAINVLTNFIMDRSEHFLRETLLSSDAQESTLFADALVFAKSFGRERYIRAMARVQQYIDMHGDETNIEMLVAVFLSDLSAEEIVDYKNFLRKPDDHKSKKNKIIVIRNINRIQKVANLPALETLASGFSLQNYINMVVSFVFDRGSSDLLNAIFADRTQNLLSLYNECKKTEDKIKEIEMMIDEDRLQLKMLKSGDSNESMEEEYLKTSINNKENQISVLKEDLVQQAKQRDGAIELYYAVYVHIASKLGFSDGFETLRNAPFILNNPQAYSNIVNNLRLRLNGIEYDELDGVVSELASSLEKHFKEKQIKMTEHHRIKSIYSMYEKVYGKRRVNKEPKGKGRAELVGKLKDRNGKIKDGVFRTDTDIVDIAKMIENIQDLMGFHIVVEKKDRDSAMAAIEEFFEKPEIKKMGFSLAKTTKYESEADKGFTRFKYSFLYNGDVVGEMVVFSKEQYLNEVFAVTLENATSFPISHVIYKMGETVGDAKAYSDKYIEVKIDFSQFDITKEKEMKAIFHNDSIALASVTDKKSLADNFRMIKKEITGKDPLTQTTFISVKTNGDDENDLNYILELPFEATVLDVISSVKFDSKNYVLKGRGHGATVTDNNIEILGINDRIINENMEEYILEEVAGDMDFSVIEQGKARTIKGKLVEIHKGNAIDFIHAPSFIGTDGNGEITDSFIKDKISVFVRHLGLQSHRELFAAIERGFVDENALKIFLEEQQQYIIEIQTGYLDADDKSQDTFEMLKKKIEQIAADFGFSIVIPKEGENQLEPNKDQVGFKVIFNGDKAAVEKFEAQVKKLSMDVKSSLVGDTDSKEVLEHKIDIEITDEMFDLTRDGKSKIIKIKGRLKKLIDLSDSTSNLEETESGFSLIFIGTNKELPDLIKKIEALNLGFKSNKKPSNLSMTQTITALGENVNALLENMQTYPVIVTNLLITLFQDKAITSTLDSFEEMQNTTLDTVKTTLSSSDEKYSRYDYELSVSASPDFIGSSDSYVFATMDVKDEILENGVVKERGTVVLYINEAFLKAIEGFSDEERSFYLKQLAIHEATERAALLKGEIGSYEEFHSSLYQSNPDQVKLMEFAAKIAKEEMIKRDKKQIADNVAVTLMHSDELSAANPADFILICGNDEIATFEKTIELYDKGAIKMIVASGGIGRLTLPLIKKAIDMNIPIPLSDNTVITTLNEYEKLTKLSDEELKKIVIFKEADIIETILLHLALYRAMDTGKVAKDIKILKEDQSTNTRENFDNDIVKNIVEEIRTSNGGKPVRFAYIQTPMQQLRTQATFNSVFKDKILSGEIEGVSVTVSDFYQKMSSEAITRQAAGEILRIIIYSLKGDTLPIINENGYIFDGVLNGGTLIQITALLENSWFRKAIRKEMLNLINNTKDSNGRVLFPSKESIIAALADKVHQDSYQFEAMKMFLDFVYYDAEGGIKYKALAEKALLDSRVLSKTPFVIQEVAINAGHTPQYLSHSDKVFVFDIENAVLNADLIAYMGSYDSKAFSVTQTRYINPNDVLFTLKVNTGLRDITIKASLKKVKTERGIFYDIQYSVPFIYEVATADINEEAKAQIFSAIFENSEIMEKLKSEGLDLSKSVDRLFIENLPQDKTLTTVGSVAQRIAESAGLDGEVRKIEHRAEKKGLYNEKLTVAAMLRNSGDTGIGEITSLQNYAETVLKAAGVNGFTMYDISLTENPLAANYLLLDWMSVAQAQGIVTKEELSSDISERDTVNKEQVARRKILASLKVYEKLSSEQRSEVNAYQLANASWLDSFAAQEKAKYNIDIDQNTFIKIMALHQMLFEKQLKQSISKMADMDISMYINGINSSNAGAIISKWVAAGITSFTLEIDSVDRSVLDAVIAAAAKSGFFINVAVKSQNMTPQTAKLIADRGYTPIVSFQDLSMYGNISGYKLEINDKTFEKITSNLEELLKNTAQSGAQSVDYPIGLLWGEVISENSVQNYRVPAKGSKRFGGTNLGLFKVGQKTFEESYAGSYLNAVEIGLSMNISEAAFDINALKTVEVNGESLPAAYAAALIGSFAKQNRLSEIQDFEKVIISLINELGTKENLKAARQYLDNLVSAYNSSKGQQQEINAAKIAGFIQGLSENIIVNGLEGQFTSKSIAKVYANLMAEASLFKAGYYPSGYSGALPAETLLSKVENVLFRQTLANAVIEIEPMLLNLSIPIQKTGFTFDIFKAGEMVKSKGKSEKASQIYTTLTGYMFDILIDKVVTRDQIRKSVRISSMEAVKSIMSAA